MPPQTKFDQKLLTEQLRLHRVAAPQSVMVAAIAGCALLAVLWNHVSDRSLLTWLACLPVALLIRLGVAWAHSPKGQLSEPSVRWRWIYRASMATHGLTWALMTVIVWPHVDPALYSMIGLALFAVTIVALMVVSYDLVAALMFAVPALTPMLNGLLGNPTFSTELRVTVACLLSVSFLQVWRAHLAFREATRRSILEADRAAAFTEKASQVLEAQRALAAKSTVLSLLMETSQQGFWFLDANGTTVDINPAMCRKLGCQRETMIGQSVLAFFTNDDLAVIECELVARRQGVSGRFEIGFNHPNRERAHFLVDATVIRSAEEGVQGSMGVWTDITQARRDHMALRIYELSVNSITDMVSVIDESWTYRMVNDAWCSQLGKERHAVIGQKSHKVFLAGTSDERKAALLICLEKGGEQKVTGRVNLPGLADKILETSYYPYTDQVDGARCVVLISRDITPRMLADEKLESLSKELTDKSDELHLALENIAQGFIAYRPDGRIAVFNQRAASLLDLPDSVMAPGASYQSIQQFQLARGDLADMHELVDSAGIRRFHAEGNGNSPNSYVRKTRSGSSVEVRTQHLKDGGWVRTYTDVTSYLKALEALSESEMAHSAMLNAFPGYVSAFDDKFIFTYVNKAFSDYLSCTPDQIVGRHVAEILGNSVYLVFTQEVAVARRTGVSRREIQLRNTPTGQVLELDVTHTCGPGKADGTQVNYSFAIDITERKIAEAKITELAFYDQLTGLANRTLLMDRLKQSIVSNVRHTQQGAVLLIDLDNFKILNDTLGHDIGDLLLKQVSTRLQACVREGDTVARLGGDEFVIILVGLSGDMNIAAGAIETAAQKIRAELNKPYDLDKVTYHCSASMGATLFAATDASVDDLLKQADMAMYTAKDGGRNAFRFFDHSMQSVIVARAALETDFRRALAASEFELYFQPQINRNGQVSGCEALVRWQHPEKGLLPPIGFIPMAEESGLILPLGAWVLDQACQQLAKWAHQPSCAHLVIAVNVSARQLQQKHFVADVVATLEKTGANPKQLKLELTESVLVSNLEDAITKMSALKAMGVGLSLDDFGTGFSSLSYLSRLPLDQIKIDRSFVSNIETRDDAVAICAATISLAHALKLQVVAEGVETEPQRYFLSTVHKCDYIQGYLYSRPVRLADFEAYLTVNRPY